MKIKLQVTMLDTWRTSCAISYENEHVPYGRRQVTVELTPEQVAQLEPREVGRDGRKAVLEEIGPVWLEMESHGHQGLDTDG